MTIAVNVIVTGSDGVITAIGAFAASGGGIFTINVPLNISGIGAIPTPSVATA